MSIVHVKGLKRYKVKGRWYAYHRKTGVRLKSEFGTAAFISELAALEGRSSQSQLRAGTLGLLLASYRRSSTYVDLAAATKHGYGRMMNLLKPLDEMPLAEITP